MTKKTPEGETIWITGASSGIGREIAIQLAMAGNQVMVTARSEQALQALAQQYSNITAAAADVTESSEHLSECLQKHCDHLDRVILNAGTCEYFDVAQPDWTMMSRVMNINFQGSVNSLQAAMPLLQRSRSGHIIAMASQASRLPFPRAQAYGASKAALTYFMETMAVDLAETSIDVSIVQLGFVDTPMTAQNDFPMPWLMTAADAAEQLLHEIVARPHWIRFPKRLSWFIGFGQSLSGLWVKYVAPKLSRA